MHSGPAGLLNAGPGWIEPELARRAGAGPPGPGQARRARADSSAPPKTAGLQLARQVRAEPPRAGKDCLALKRLDRARAKENEMLAVRSRCLSNVILFRDRVTCTGFVLIH